MDNSTLLIKLKQRLNKLDSQDYDNIECWQFVEAFNKVQLDWCRRTLHGGNMYKEGDEMSKRRIEIRTYSNSLTFCLLILFYNCVIIHNLVLLKFNNCSHLSKVHNYVQFIIINISKVGFYSYSSLFDICSINTF